jgi:hypothetical protein
MCRSPLPGSAVGESDRLRTTTLHTSLQEPYGFGILNEGHAIAVAKNVKIRLNEFVMPAPHGWPAAQTRSPPPMGS